jgi:hypothetical protein
VIEAKILFLPALSRQKKIAAKSTALPHGSFAEGQAQKTYLN